MIEHVLAEVSLADKRSLHMKQSRVKYFSSGAYDSFCDMNGIINNGACYLPSFKLACLDVNDPFFRINYFHEYLGHGLFTDNNGAMKFFTDQNQANESFALWHEHTLASKFGLEKLWIRKYQMMHPTVRQLHDILWNFSQKLGEIAIYAESGFAKQYSISDLKIIADYVSPRHIFSVVYGSRKPYSDIDMFIVGDNTFQSFNGWLDIFSLSAEDYFLMSRNMDIGVISAMLTGEFVSGSKTMFCKMLSNLMLTRTSSQTKKWALLQSQKMQQFFSSEDQRTRRNAIRYHQTYSASATLQENLNASQVHAIVMNR